MTRLLAAARLLTIAILLAGSPLQAGPGPSLAAARASALRPPALPPAGPRLEAAVPSSERTTVLDINGPGGIHLHNRFLAGGLLLYVVVTLGALVLLEKRRAAAAAILVAGLAIGGLLLLRGFG